MATTDQQMDLTIQLVNLVEMDNTEEMVDQEVQVDRPVQVDKVVQMDQIIQVEAVQVEQVALLIRTVQMEEHHHLDLQVDRMVRVDILMK